MKRVHYNLDQPKKRYRPGYTKSVQRYVWAKDERFKVIENV
jgi:hypothetical protein